MDGEGIVWLIAVGWVILSWIMKAVKGAVKRTGDQMGVPDEKPDAHELRERRARLRAEQARRKRLEADPTPREAALDGLKRELERVMGVHVEEEHGPKGRRATVPMEADEEVEEFDSLEEEPVVVSLETTGDRGTRVIIDQDSQAGEIVRRRHAVAEEHSRPLTRADHQEFDARIRAPVAVVKAETPARRPQSFRQAFIWSEILGKPVSER
jgi:S1-C subfamily serine protease